jgi:hypothetical protein
MNREGTLHIVLTNPGQPVPRYSVGFADYKSPGGAMKTTNVNGEEALRNFFVRIGINQRIAQPTLETLRTEGVASVLRVSLPEEVLVELGLQDQIRGGKAKVEAAIRMLKGKGHTVQAIIRHDGTMWFQVDESVLVAWQEMQNIADGVYSYDELLRLYSTNITVRFTIFNEPNGPVLAYSVAAPFAPASFASKAGVRYPNSSSLIRALDGAGLPGEEIATMRDPTKIYTLTGAQLSRLNLKLPDE